MAELGFGQGFRSWHHRLFALSSRRDEFCQHLMSALLPTLGEDLIAKLGSGRHRDITLARRRVICQWPTVERPIAFGPAKVIVSELEPSQPSRRLKRSTVCSTTPSQRKGAICAFPAPGRHKLYLTKDTLEETCLPL